MFKFLVVFFLAFISTNAQVDFSILSIPSDLKENANSVLVKENIIVDLSEEAKMIVEEYSVRTIFNELGNRHLNAVEYYDKNSKVKKIEAYIYDALGNEIAHYKKRDFKDVSAADGFSLYSDNRVLFLDYTPTTYPYTIVYTSETETGNTAFIRPWTPISGYVTSTKESTFTLKFNPANKPKYKSKNLEGYSISIDEKPTEYKFKASNIKAIKYEELGPNFKDIAPNISVALNEFYLEGEKGYGSDWQTFGKWMNDKLLSGVSELPIATVEKVKALVANEETNEAKARKIYQYVQDKVRYISIQIGIGGWKPMLAKDVDYLGYGDCKALTNYTKALLDVVGVPSYYTVLYAGNEERNIDKDFSSMQGNHVILGIPDEENITWLECTSQEVPYSYLGNFTDDRDVLLVTPEGGKIVTTKKYTSKENLQEQKAIVNLDEDGGLTINFSGISWGTQYGDKFRNNNKTVIDQEKEYKNRWGYLNGLTIRDVSLSNDKENISFSENIELYVPNYTTKVGDDFLLCLNALNQSQYIPPRYRDRSQNLYLREGYLDNDEIIFNIPETYTIEELPEDKSIKNKFGAYEITFRTNEKNQIIYKRSFLLNKGKFSKEEYKNYRNFIRQVAKLDKTKILLKKNS